MRAEPLDVERVEPCPRPASGHQLTIGCEALESSPRVMAQVEQATLTLAPTRDRGSSTENLAALLERLHSQATTPRRFPCSCHHEHTSRTGTKRHRLPPVAMGCRMDCRCRIRSQSRQDLGRCQHSEATTRRRFPCSCHHEHTSRTGTKRHKLPPVAMGCRMDCTCRIRSQSRPSRRFPRSR
jgi:hypothetical protein